MIALPRGIVISAGLASIGGVALVLLCGFFVQELIRARNETSRFAHAADLLLAPADAAEGSTKRLGHAVRGEIESIDRAVTEAMGKLRGLENSVARQAAAIANAAAAASNSTDGAHGRLEAQSRAFSELANAFGSKARLIEETVGRQVSVLREALDGAQTSTRNMETRIAASADGLKQSTDQILAKTEQLSFLAKTANQKAATLDATIDEALKAIATASHLVDAARASTAMASESSRTAAESIREAIAESIERAARAAERVKAEAATMEAYGVGSLNILRDAGDQARASVEAVRMAADAFAAGAYRPAPAEPQIVYVPTPMPAAPQPAAYGYAPPNAERGPERVLAPPNPGRPTMPSPDLDDMVFVPPSNVAPSAAPPPGAADAGRGKPSEKFSWTSVLRDLGNADAERDPMGATAERLAQALSEAGAGPAEVLSGEKLDDIMIRAIEGAVARRWAVWDASPDALRRVKTHLASNPHLREEATRLLAEDAKHFSLSNPRSRIEAHVRTLRGQVYLLLDAALN